MHAAAREAGAEDALGRRSQAFVVVGDDELDAAPAAVGERAEELDPEDLGLRGPGGDARDRAPGIGPAIGVDPAPFVGPGIGRIGEPGLAPAR